MTKRRKDKDRVTVDEIRLTTGQVVTNSIIPGEALSRCFVNGREVGHTARFTGSMLRLVFQLTDLYDADQTPDKNTGLTGKELREAYEHDADGESI